MKKILPYTTHSKNNNFRFVFENTLNRLIIIIDILFLFNFINSHSIYHFNNVRLSIKFIFDK